MGKQVNPKKGKPKIVLKDCRYVLFVYWLPAYIKIRNGKPMNVTLLGNDPGVASRLSYERLVRFAIEPYKENNLGYNEGGYLGRYALCLLKDGLNGEILRVWTRFGKEISPEEFQKNRKFKDKPVGHSLLRAWILPHERFLQEMKRLNMVSDHAKGITWYSSDVDVKEGQYVRGYDVALHSFINMLKQWKGKFAEVRIYDNSSRDGAPIANINWDLKLTIKDFLFRETVTNSKWYRRPELGLTYHQYT